MGAPEEQLKVRAAIAEFVGDDARVSLEFPPMPAGERKNIKAIADTYPDLVSESFGMGSERCIHLFKKDAGHEGSGSVTVKNTFIDDWTQEDGEEPVVFRSMPSQLSDAGKGLPIAARVERSKLDLSPITEGSPKLPSDAFRLGCGKQVDAFPPKAGQAGRGGLPTLLGNCQVRNTFIHIDTVSPDDRSVRSMPHDMFRQSLHEELDQLAMTGTYSEREVPAFAEVNIQTPERVGIAPADTFALGMHVVIQGLTKIPAFNGQCGIVERLDESTGRYSVKLTTGGPGIPKFAKVKGDNLCVATPPVLSVPPGNNAVMKGPQAYFGQFGGVADAAGCSGLTTPLKLTALV